MSLFPLFDNRTLLLCQIFLALAFSIAFLDILRSKSGLPGIRSIAFSFALGIPGIALLILRGSIPDFISITGANCIVFLCYVLFCDGILHIIESHRSLLPPVVAAFITLGFIFYFSQFHPSIVSRLLVISFNLAFFRGYLAAELLRRANGRNTMRLFGLFMALSSVLNLLWAVLTLMHHQASLTSAQVDHIQTFTLIQSIFSISLTGLFSLAISHDRLLSLVRAESETDITSGILNRRGIEKRLDIELRRIDRSRQPLSIALIDIDFFKSINDTAGHAAGDTALRSVAHAISTSLRAYDLLGRFGGDEFLLVLPQTSASGARIVAERIAEAVRSMPPIRSVSALTLSIGISEAVAGDYSTSLFTRADQALYQAKNAGRDCIRTVLPLFEDDSPTETLFDSLATVTRPKMV